MFAETNLFFKTGQKLTPLPPTMFQKTTGGFLFMKTAAIYARYSSDRQTEQSIYGQIHVCMEYAERNDIVIVGTYIDRAMTGTNDNREQFQKMLKASDKKPFDYVLVYKLDRFSRNKYEMAIHRKHLKDNGIKILSAMENIPDTPEGILLESLLEGVALFSKQNHENRLIARNRNDLSTNLSYHINLSCIVFFVFFVYICVLSR